MIDTAITYLTKVDSLTAIEFLNQQDDPVAVMNAYFELVVQLYWEQKNLPAVVIMARAGMQYGLMASAVAANPNPASEIKSVVKRLAYNLASFTWPGWNQPGIVISQSDIAIGLDAAKINLRLANELDKGDLPLSRAYWMLGGHHLASGDLSEAKKCFDEAARYGAVANQESEQLLAQSFSLITVMLVSSENSAASGQLAQIKSRLTTLEHGAGFIQQIDTALNAFTEP